MVFALFCSAFEREQEMAAIIALRRDGQVLGVQEISRGTRHATMMDPSEIIIAAANPVGASHATRAGGTDSSVENSDW